MKKLLKIFLPILVISIAVSLLFIPAKAESSAGGYAVWASEEDYLANPNSPKTKSKSATIVASHIQNGGYLLCYGDIELDKDTNVMITNGSTVVIDLGGYTMTANGSITIGANAYRSPTYFTLKNGTVNHMQAQFFKPQPNSTTVIENVNLNVKYSWGSLIYSDSFRNFTFRNSVINYTAAGNACQITPPREDTASSAQSYAPEAERSRDFVMNIVFDNSYFITAENGNFLNFRDVEGTLGFLEVSFINGSGFNTLGPTFLSWEGIYDSWVHINIEKSAKFASPSVPLGELNESASVNYYNSIEHSGNYMVFGEKTELAPEGYINTPDGIQKLIWGFSGDAEYPHSLCHTLYSVNFYDTEDAPISMDMHGYSGYADGVTLDFVLGEESYFFKNIEGAGQRVFKRVPGGWSATPARTEYTKKLTVTGNASYYAVSEEVGPASVVEFADADLSSVASALFTTEITDTDFASFASGAYLYFYDDVTLASTSPVEISGTLYIDLGGHKLMKNTSMADGVAAFNIIGGALNVRNGIVIVSTTGFVSVLDDGALNLSDVKVSFDSYPAFTLEGGSVNITGTDKSAIEGRTLDRNVPAFMLSGGGAKGVNISNTAITLEGPLATHSAFGEVADIHISLSDCENVKVHSIFKLYSAVSDNVPEDTALDIYLDGCRVDAERVFDIASRSDGTPAIEASFYLSDSLFTSDPRDTSGTVICPIGYVILTSGSGDYRYSVARPSGIEMKFNLALSFDFMAKFYIKSDADIRYVDTYLGRTAVSELDVVNLEGVDYYVVTLGGISASDALDTLELSVGFVGADSLEYSTHFAYSPTDYFAELLGGSDPLARKLSAAAMNYITAAYAYKSCELPAGFAELLAGDSYAAELRDMNAIPTIASSGALGNISLAFSGVQLYLSSNISFRFNLRADFTGTLVISGVTYNVTGGKVGELTYIEVSPDAALWYSGSVAVTGNNALGAVIEGEYSLIDYASSQAAAEPQLNRLLAALYAYCYEASVYTNGGVLPPYIEGTPAVDVTYR